ncbi:MAG: hypothetical protein Ta2F_18260 [Termitinemataceae bacterium]|nr:MAG: hypothetical protein Ta2F_18260 [Termitinemataceae bacterium]
MSAVENCKAKGKIGDTDVPPLISELERLYKELFSQYDELAEGDIMLSEKLDYYVDKYIEEGEKKGEKKAMLKVAKNLLAMGDDVKKVAKATGLPLETIKSLQSKQKVA